MTLFIFYQKLLAGSLICQIGHQKRNKTAEKTCWSNTGNLDQCVQFEINAGKIITLDLGGLLKSRTPGSI